MDITAIVQQLQERLGQINRAIQALEGSTPTYKRRGPKPGSRHMSAKARALISAAQKKRWAKQKRAVGNSI